MKIVPISIYPGFDLYSYFYGLVKQIPEGYVATYGDLAMSLGDIRAARACAFMLSINRSPGEIPGYRVVRKDGAVGNHHSKEGIIEAVRNLKRNGIAVSGGKVENIDKCRFTDFSSEYPLKAMKEEQEKLRGEFEDTIESNSNSICAIDVSYGDFMGVGSAVISDGKSLIRKSVRMDVRFPYIPGYLSYREFPFAEKLCRGFDGLVFIDGNGQLHYREMGFATFTGLMLNLRTIGIAKSMLEGKLNGKYVVKGNKRVGFVMNSREYISAGHGISLETSVKIVRELSGTRYPVMLRDAHNSCTSVRKAICYGKTRNIKHY